VFTARHSFRRSRSGARTRLFVRGRLRRLGGTPVETEHQSAGRRREATYPLGNTPARNHPVATPHRHARRRRLGGPELRM